MTHGPLLPVAVLGSGRGSNFLALADAIDRGEIPARIVLVASDLPHAPILEHAAARGLPTYVCPTGKFKTKLEPEIESALAQTIRHSGAKLVVLAGYMRVLKSPLLQPFAGRILNIHPSLLPAFKGLEAWKQALDAGVAETGCTVHWVDDSLDGGPIIRQEKVPVLPGDSATTLHARIQEAEHRLLPAVVADLARGGIPWPDQGGF
ncbi:MAG: phosphoribosylglycinamide formyltransferase [Candidatus Methylacidiphilales bacterium]|nr:phosphoribosylglycinamide formyltransferase [Candidatus Methylacidiphilales bacterium]